MALRNIRYEGDEILRKKSKPVKEINEAILTLLSDMAQTLKELEGLGLAAPQVGVLRRVVVVDMGEGPIELINPEIVETSGTQQLTEGCLSLPGKSGVVERAKYCKVKALDSRGEEFTIEGEDINSVLLCHEIDHLDGILYTDKAIRMVNDDEEDNE